MVGKSRSGVWESDTSVAEFHDMPWLDNDDLNEYGINSHSVRSLFDATIGITAWWQLQHQYGYAPLVTRTVVEQSFEVPTK
jgi:hypothetical protein